MGSKREIAKQRAGRKRGTECYVTVSLLHPHVIIFRYISVTGLTASANLAFIKL